MNKIAESTFICEGSRLSSPRLAKGILQSFRSFRMTDAGYFRIKLVHMDPATRGGYFGGFSRVADRPPIGSRRKRNSRPFAGRYF